MQKKEICLT